MPERGPEADTAADPIREAAEIVDRDRAAQIAGQRQGMPSLYTCTDCGGTLWQVGEPELLLFRCHVGHTLTGELLLADQIRAAEDALWRAIRTLTDQTVLGRELARYARDQGNETEADRCEAVARAVEHKAQALRALAEAE
jgi:two-component system chemotaxis response regulator CheB